MRVPTGLDVLKATEHVVHVPEAKFLEQGGSLAGKLTILADYQHVVIGRKPLAHLVEKNRIGFPIRSEPGHVMDAGDWFGVAFEMESNIQHLGKWMVREQFEQAVYAQVSHGFSYGAVIMPAVWFGRCLP